MRGPGIAPTSRHSVVYIVAALILIAAPVVLGLPQLPPRRERLTTTPVARTPSVQPVSAAEQYGSPVPQPTKVSSPFGPRWKYSSSRYDYHRGIDYFDARGTPIVSIGAGTVFRVYRSGDSRFPGGGNTVVIRHTLQTPITFHGSSRTSFYSYYLHLDTIEPALVEGASISRGAAVGTMGDTGDTSFIHLHFETRLGGYCSWEYQAQNNPTSSQCGSGFDPHVHPYVFVPSSQPPGGTKSLYRVEPPAGKAYAVRYEAIGHLDVDAINTDLGTVAFNTREGFTFTTLEELDALETIVPWVSILPGVFRSTYGGTSGNITYDFHFRSTPQWIEVVDVYGNAIRTDFSGTSGPSTSGATGMYATTSFISTAVALFLVLLVA